MSIKSQPAAVPLHPLVAREAELRTLVRLWRSARLVTLYGQSGVGKSVLARAAAAMLAGTHGTSVVCLDAAAAGGRIPVLRLLAGARRRLGDARSGRRARDLSDRSPVAPTQSDARAYSESSEPTAPLFVLLDDLPTAAHEAAQGVVQWLVTHPEAHLLIVSRRPLELLGEHAVPLAPLRTAPEGETPAPAGELFQDFARQGHPASPAVDPETTRTICTALDGLPTALEAAAALVGILPATGVARLALEDPLSLTLRGTSLQATLAATWDDLAADERRYLAANAGWPGTFSDHAAAHLYGQGPTAAVTARLARLGLLRIEATHPHLRYRLSPLVRHFALETGQPAEEAWQERRARYLLGLAERPATVRGSGSVDRDDLLAIRWAWRWLSGRGDGEAVGRFARALAGPLRHWLGDPDEAVELLESALAWARAVGSPERVPLESSLAATECRLGRLDRAEARLRALLEERLPTDEMAIAWLRLAVLYGYRGAHAAAVEAGLKAADSLRGSRSRSGASEGRVALAWTLHGLSEDQRHLGRPEAARAALEESGTLFARFECASGRAAYLAALSMEHAARGETEEAAWQASESLRLAESAGDGPARARALQVQAHTVGRRDPSRALTLVDEAAALWERFGRPAELTAALLDAAELAQGADFPPERSLGAAREALCLARRDGYFALEARALLALAECYRRLGRLERAAQYAAEAGGAAEQTDDLEIRKRCARWEPGGRAGDAGGADRAVPASETRDGAGTPAAGTSLPPAARSRLLLIRLLGPLRVEGPDGAALTTRLRPKEQRVLARLALEPGRVVPRDELLETFWPQANFAAAERSLRTVVSSLRRALRSALPEVAPALLRGQLDGYCLEAAVCSVDVALFREAVAEARAVSTRHGPRKRTTAPWRQAVELYQGDLLSDFPYDDWCLATRERLRNDFMDCLFQLARTAFNVGAPGEARELAARIVTLDPAEERAHRLLMRCYAVIGRPAEAVRQYERCRAALWEELGGRPAPATLSLLETIRAGATLEGEEERPGRPAAREPSLRWRADRSGSPRIE